MRHRRRRVSQWGQWGRWGLTLATLSTLAVRPAAAQAPTSCALDTGPGSTLFLPYFEVDLSGVNQPTTLISVANADDAPVLTKVTLWTDLGIPTLGFFVYLTGYDVQSINLRDVFEGRLPRTADQDRDPADTISPRGPLSQDKGIANCASFLPPPSDPLGAQPLALQRQHRGLPTGTFGDLCVGTAHGDQIARGFLTIDAVNNCTSRSPKDPGYFVASGLGDATDQNVLWGDFFYLDPAQNFAQGENLVRLRSFPGRFGAGSETFYGWLHGHSGKDGRQPLPSQWVTRFVNGGAFTGGTDLVYWHAPNAPLAPFACNTPPRAFARDEFIVSDEQENFTFDFCGIQDPPDPNCGQPFHNVVARRIDIETELHEVHVPFDFGAMYIGHESVGVPVVPPLPRRQSWLGSLMSADGRFGVGMAATPLNDGCKPSICLPGVCP
jgi:hypothetical protein